MAQLHVNQIASRVEPVGGLVDVTDVQPEQLDIARLTRGLAAWVVVQLSGLDDQAAAASVTDGYGDNGIDAIAIDSANSIVYLVQSKWDRSGSSGPELGEVLKFVQGVKDFTNSDFRKFNSKVKSRSVEFDGVLADAKVRYVLVLATTGAPTLSTHAQSAVDGLIDELNDPIQTASFKHLGQAALHEFLVSGVQGPRPDLSNVAVYDYGTKHEPYVAQYGQVAAAEVGQWHIDHGDHLYSQNLRQVLKDSEVNDSLLDTLKSEPEHFWYLNNGVTVLCKKIEKAARGGASKKVGSFTFKEVSVVNGAQTVGTIGSAAGEGVDLDDVWVTVRFISLEGCPPEFASEVTRGTNTQNRVERRDFVALDSLQNRLANEMAVDGRRYVIKSGEAPTDPSTGCNVVEATIALACAKPVPDFAVQAKREIGRLWIGAEDSSSHGQYKQLFTNSLTSDQIWRAVSALRAIDDALEAEKDKRSDKARAIGTHGNRLIAHEVFQRLPSGTLTDPNADLPAAIAKVPALVSDVYAQTEAIISTSYSAKYLASLFKNLGHCRSMCKELATQR